MIIKSTDQGHHRLHINDSSGRITMEVQDQPHSAWPLILACYRSGQVSERQWTEHLKDAEFAAWVEEQGR